MDNVQLREVLTILRDAEILDGNFRARDGELLEEEK